MDKQKQKIGPDYQKIYSDIINKKYPDKKDVCEYLLEKQHLSVLEVIELNQRIFGSTKKCSQKYRSYTESDILQMLDYQRKNQLNNTELAQYFSLSRNSVTKWKRQFPNVNLNT
ncbi:transposase [Chryseobacterium lactis]|uniref:Helix-turn-helix domain-containing protein n=1 Tax=Chryseobacterium lactis TaxID=1241981 RepID=A0A3G6RHL3_CHRLC|nr:transposase [Chryseobacterium lactis]AZA83293.1 helix-turn-helix domain-containing protein [Chryseobacterium lactis]AZB03678.1 helix-turn-helix domain-containing protein [Chryseobacterium lactis]PNW11114.1 transposase [Chryseobacterium lactis]